MMLLILQELLVNIVIIIASLALGNMLTRGRRVVVKRQASLPLGLLSGVLGCLLMVYSVQVKDNIYIDFRSVPIILMGVYISFSSAMLTATIIGLFRLVVFGITHTSTVALGIALLCGLICGVIGRLKLSVNKKWLLASLSMAAVTSLGFVFLVPDKRRLGDILPAYLIGMAVILLIAYALMTYIMRDNAAYYSMESASAMDYLTGLHNVRFFSNSIENAMAYAKSTNTRFSLLYIDIDCFKRVNDTYGHLSGDKLLRDFAMLLRQEARDVDLVTRNGGEEFSILLTNCEMAAALSIAERIRAKVEAADFVTLDKEHIRITISIGVACFPETSTCTEGLISMADNALYAAKRAGRNRVMAAAEGLDQSEPLPPCSG